MSNNSIYQLAILVKEKVLEVMKYQYIDFTPLNPLLELEESSLNGILEQFRGVDKCDLYYRDGEFHYRGHGLLIPSTRKLMNYISEHQREIRTR